MLPQNSQILFKIVEYTHKYSQIIRCNNLSSSLLAGVRLYVDPIIRRIQYAPGVDPNTVRIPTRSAYDAHGYALIPKIEKQIFISTDMSGHSLFITIKNANYFKTVKTIH